MSFTSPCIYAQGNPFDIEGRSQNEIIAEILNEEEGLQNRLEPNVGANEDQRENNEVYSNKSESNPFDVSHIPLRKSKLKEKADAFSTQSVELSNQANPSNTFIFWLILLCIFLLALIVSADRRAVINAGKSIFNENMLKLN